MRKEIILRLSVKSDKCQKKAMKVAASVSGVESVTLAGGDRNLLLVIGDDVDSNSLTKKIEKKVCPAEIVELRTLDTFEPTAPMPIPGGTKKHQHHQQQDRHMAMAMVASPSPYRHGHWPQQQQQQRRQYAHTAPPASPYYGVARMASSSPYAGGGGAYGQYGYGHPSPMGGYGDGGYGSSYSRVVARSHPANYSPLVERHDYYPMDYSSSSSSSSRGGSASYKAVPRRDGGDNSCCIQ